LQSRVTYNISHWRSGPSTSRWSRGETLPGLGGDGAQQACGMWCAGKGFTYMALQWTNECFCDNDYGAGGRAPDSECDVDNDGEADCGTGTLEIPEGGLTEMQTQMQRDGPPACSWRNAVYSLTPTYSGMGAVQTVTTRYRGCYRDQGGQPEGKNDPY
jgi:hypothetical protein